MFILFSLIFLYFPFPFLLFYFLFLFPIFLPFLFSPFFPQESVSSSPATWPQQLLPSPFVKVETSQPTPAFGPRFPPSSPRDLRPAWPLRCTSQARDSSLSQARHAHESPSNWLRVSSWFTSCRGGFLGWNSHFSKSWSLLKQARGRFLPRYFWLSLECFDYFFLCVFLLLVFSFHVFFLEFCDINCKLD